MLRISSKKSFMINDIRIICQHFECLGYFDLYFDLYLYTSVKNTGTPVHPYYTGLCNTCPVFENET